MVPEKKKAHVVILAVFFGGMQTFFRAEKCKHMLSISGFTKTLQTNGAKVLKIEITSSCLQLGCMEV